MFRVLENHVTTGELNDVIGELPQSIRRLWPRLQAPQQRVP